MKKNIIQLLFMLGILQQASLYSAQVVSIDELVTLVDKKRSALASGEVRYIITEGVIAENGAEKLRGICRNISFQDSVDIKIIEDIIKNDGSKLVTRKNTLLYSGNNFVLTEIVPSSAFDSKLIELSGLEGKDVIFKMSAFSGLYSFLDPFRNQLQLNQVDLPGDYPIDSVLSLDLTLADYKNILTPVPDRSITINQEGNTLAVKFQRSINGYELQKYTIWDGNVYLTEIDAIMGNSKTKVDKFLLNYLNRSDLGINIKSPSIVVDVTQSESGPIMFKLYKIESWIIREISDTEFLIEAPPGVKLIK